MERVSRWRNAGMGQRSSGEDCACVPFRWLRGGAAPRLSERACDHLLRLCRRERDSECGSMIGVHLYGPLELTGQQ